MEEDKSSKKKAKEGSFTDEDLTDTQKKDYRFVLTRIEELKKTRQSHYGNNLDKIWADADRDYVPHRIKGAGKKVLASGQNEDDWGSSTVTLGANDWQADISQANPYIKIQTALSILVDQNPGAVLTPSTKKYQATTEINKQLYQRSWEVAKSKNQLKLFVFNLAKYGWAVARTYPLRIERKVKVLKEYNPEDPESSTYEEKNVVEYNDIMRENLDPRNVWIDDKAKPSSPRTLNDWMFRKVYDLDEFKAEFAGYKKRLEMVMAGGNTQEVLDYTTKGATKDQEANNESKVEVFFYENRAKDLFMVIANGVPVIIEPLPIADPNGLKKLSVWQAYWNLRHGESPYGIGIYEAIRFDQSMLDRIRNMTIDQLTLSIYKMFFFQGTQSLTETGDIKIKPGVGKQVLDPKNVNWMEVPGPGQDAYLGIEMFRKDVDEASGITDPLLGQITGKTAFEIGQAKESALKRLKNPLDNILEALAEDGYITLSLIQILYSVPETYEIADERLINDYLQEVGADPELYERGSPAIDETTGMETPGAFTAKVYREFPLNLDKDEGGNLIEAKDTRFFRIKPNVLPWEGTIQIKPQSLLTPSKQVEKALELEMYNILIPLMQGLAQEFMMKAAAGTPPSLDDLSVGKVAKAIVKLYDKDPRDIFPDLWLQPPQPPPPPDGLFVQAGQGGAPPGAPPGAPGAPTAAPQSATPQAGGIVSNLLSSLNPFKGS